jgi:anthranilate synthase component 1
MYYIKFEDFFIVGSSPETLVKVENGKVMIKPIAGTRPKEKGREKEIKESLLSDPKERAEHLMLLDLGRNDVGRVSKIGSINVKESFQIQETSHLYHIYSTVEGDLDSNEDRISALCAGFPAGTVTGAPKIRAMEIINEIENNKRGIYAGAVGYFSSNGDMDTAIALRTAIIKSSKMYVQAGGGVVYDSLEEYEYNESLNKAKALFAAAENLIEKG